MEGVSEMKNSSHTGVLSAAIPCRFCGLCVDNKSLPLETPGSCFSMPVSWGHRQYLIECWPVISNSVTGRWPKSYRN